MNFCCNQGSRDSEHAVVPPIWVGGGAGVGVLPVTVRPIDGDSELLLRTWIIGGLDTTVDFGKRKSHIGQGDWEAMTRNKMGQRVFPLPQLRAVTQN